MTLPVEESFVTEYNFTLIQHPEDLASTGLFFQVRTQETTTRSSYISTTFPRGTAFNTLQLHTTPKPTMHFHRQTPFKEIFIWHLFTVCNTLTKGKNTDELLSTAVKAVTRVLVLQLCFLHMIVWASKQSENSNGHKSTWLQFFIVDFIFHNGQLVWSSWQQHAHLYLLYAFSQTHAHAQTVRSREGRYLLASSCRTLFQCVCDWQRGGVFLLGGLLQVRCAVSYPRPIKLTSAPGQNTQTHTWKGIIQSAHLLLSPSAVIKLWFVSKQHSFYNSLNF